LKRVLNKKDEILKLRLEQSAKVVAEVLKDRSIVNELTGQITKKLKITGNKESLTFRELFQESDGRKTQSIDAQNPKVFSIDANVANHFKTKYLTVLKNKSYEHAEKYEILEKPSDISTNVYDDGSSCFECMNLPPATEIYFPYSENFLSDNYGVDPNLTYTVSSHPIDNSDENEGVVWNSITQTWDYVLVDDNYAWLNPTYIITIDDGPSQTDIINSTLDGILADYRPAIFLDNTSSTPPLSTNSNLGTTNRVYFGKLHLEKFAEGLFDGGSEIVLIRPSITPTLNANGTLNTANVSIEQSIPLDKIRRREIRRMQNNPDRTVWVGGTFTNDWKSTNANLPLVIYEYDQGGSLDISLPSVKFKIEINGQDVEVTTPSSFKYNITTKSNPYLVEDIPRSFYSTHKNIANPGINPGQYDTWRSWGFQATSVTLITENTWFN
jgi:hypothetical protein